MELERLNFAATIFFLPLRREDTKRHKESFIALYAIGRLFALMAKNNWIIATKTLSRRFYCSLRFLPSLRLDGKK